MIADWYMKYVGTPHEASGLPWLYQKYAGHDNNRDGFALEPARVAAPRQVDVPRLGAAGLRRSSPDGQRQRASVHSAVRRADSPGWRSAGVARDVVVGRAHGQPPRGRGQDRRHRLGDLFRLGPHGLPLDHAVPQHRRHADRIGERAAGDADVHASGSASRRAARAAGIRIADQHAQPLEGRLVARARHRRAAEDRGVGDGGSRGAKPRDRAVEHVSEGHAADRARRQRRRSRPTRSPPSSTIRSR